MIGIVGGGISGLFLLHFLAESGVEAVLFERAASPGGVMQSRTLTGVNGSVTVDLGPQRMRLTSGMRDLLSVLQLSNELRVAPTGVPFTIYHAGSLHRAPLSLRDAAQTRLISWSGKFRALGDLVTSPPQGSESVSEALTRKLGSQAYRRLAGPLFGGLYASKPEEMEARHTLIPALLRTGARKSLLVGLFRATKWEKTPVVSLRGGLGSLPLALAKLHRDRVRLEDPVRAIVPEAGRFRIESDSGVIDVDQVVLSLPAPHAAEIISQSLPSLRGALGALRYNPLAVIPMVVKDGLRTPSAGSGFKMTFDDRSATRGVTAHEALFGRKGLFTAFLGGMGSEGLLELSDSELMDLAVRDFDRVMGVEATPLIVHRTWMPGWDRTWAALDGLQLPQGLHLCAAFSDRPGISGRLAEALRVAVQLSA